MSNTPPRLSHVPPGVQCFVGDEARRRRLIEERVVAVFEGWDYEEIIPPLYDYAEVFAGKALSLKTYSFVGRDGRDRKSTRLNSSHANISYAVFCLQKKKQRPRDSCF